MSHPKKRLMPMSRPQLPLCALRTPERDVVAMKSRMGGDLHLGKTEASPRAGAACCAHCQPRLNTVLLGNLMSLANATGVSGFHHCPANTYFIIFIKSEHPSNTENHDKSPNLAGTAPLRSTSGKGTRFLLKRPLSFPASIVLTRLLSAVFSFAIVFYPLC